MFDPEKYLDVLQNIEFGLKLVYEDHTHASDFYIMQGLEKSLIAMKQKKGYAKNQNSEPDNEIEEEVIAHIVEIQEMRVGKINDLTQEEYVRCVIEVAKSVKRHNAVGGRTGYYDFIKDFIL